MENCFVIMRYDLTIPIFSSLRKRSLIGQPSFDSLRIEDSWINFGFWETAHLPLP